MIQPSCVLLTESDLCHQPAFPNIFYHTMQSYVLQAFEIVATTGVERRHSNRSNPAGSNIQKKRYPSDISSFSHFLESTRRDSNPRPSPWQGDTPPLSHSRILICTLKTAHKLFILKTSVHKRTFTKPHFVLSLLRNSVLFMIVRSLRFAELSNSHASMKFSNSGTTCELLYHFLP